MTSRTGEVAKFVLVDFFGSVVWFPIWWYTTGFMGVITAARRGLEYRVRSLGFKIWMKNFFVPMYGQYDLAGRLISVWMRLVVLVGRFIVLVAEAVGFTIGIIAWVLIPILAVIALLFKLTQTVIPLYG